ncbi:DivIVA domain-containing protein [Bifidobacterium oedipodis]|uniref:Cell wall synthesis protein Wag31 n=1 Tax=Bifidobacterium oedipodis TaxID=2675322 RepID=A0A7Y0EPG7_9BIFI|nr:DivIVA domain-containing protein [Bifidobacterium sp. DSM 109957]NMM93937.1 cell division protein DivIVA [Bifidobacterium sp. DSM 109957]
MSNPALLTPNDVRQAVFQTHRIREGYDIQEVDDLLEKVEVTIKELWKENQRLTNRLTELTGEQPDNDKTIELFLRKSYL